MALRRLLLLSACAVLSFNASGANVHPGLAEVKRVYLLSMSSGLDQYLANRLTKTGRFEVVTDPANADAIFTDRLGPAFEDQWNELYPPPPKEEPAKPSDAKNADAKSRDGAKAADSGPKTMFDDIETAPVTRISSFSRGRGNIFLVSRKDGAVVWSHFKPAKNSRVKELDSTADDIVDQLHRDLKVKK